MGLFTTPIKTLDDLYLHTLRDIYYAELQIIKALPRMIEKSSNEALKTALSTHFTETQEQIKRLEAVFQHLNTEAKGVTCEAIEGIIAEAKQVMSDVGDLDVLDAAIASAAQAVEHYEISRYGTLIAMAKRLNRDECVGPLEATLQEEKYADHKLTEVAEREVNKKAA
nr:ferritin-like domain-containing protein [uncultured Acidocella sp.]